MRILGVIRAGDVCSYYRIERPFAHLGPGVETEIWSIGDRGMPPVDYARSFDVCVLVRAYEAKFLPFVRAVSQSTAIVLDYDDLDDEPGPLRDSVNALVRHCHGLTALTPELTVLHPGPHLRFAWHNAIDRSLPLYQQERAPRDSGRFTIFLGISGQATGIASWIGSAIGRAMLRRPELYLRCVGTDALIAALGLPAERITASGLLGFEQFLWEIGGADALLYPNPTWDHPWGRGVLRVIQAGAWGVPAIATPFPSVRRFAAMSHDSPLIVEGNTPEDWTEAMVWAVYHRDEMDDRGHRARDAVTLHFDQDRSTQELLAFWRRCAAMVRGGHG